MSMQKKIISTALLLTLIVSLSVSIITAQSEKRTVLTVSAAASLKDALGEISKLYRKEKPNVILRFNYGASGALQKQIEQGAPADLFISAAARQMEALKTQGLLEDSTLRTLLSNEVVLIIPKDSALSVKSFKALTEPCVGKIALGEPKSVPAGHYAGEILEYYDIQEPIRQKAVYGKDVREVLTWVESGNADAGILYRTDALVSEKVKIAAAAPGDSHSPVAYPAAVIRNSRNSTAAEAFLAYLSGSKAREVFTKFGFKTE